jgi:hypothetical protein
LKCGLDFDVAAAASSVSARMAEETEFLQRTLPGPLLRAVIPDEEPGQDQPEPAKGSLVAGAGFFQFTLNQVIALVIAVGVLAALLVVLVSR